MNVVSIGDFFETVAEDPRMLPSHIVLYLGLINEWQRQGCPEEFEFVAVEVLKRIKLTRDTYRIRIKDLKEFGYIHYHAAENQFVKGVVAFKRL